MHTYVVIYFFNKKTPLLKTREFFEIVACSKIQTSLYFFNNLAVLVPFGVLIVTKYVPTA